MCRFPPSSTGRGVWQHSPTGRKVCPTETPDIALAGRFFMLEGCGQGCPLACLVPPSVRERSDARRSGPCFGWSPALGPAGRVWHNRTTTMPHSETVALLFGPYKAPDLEAGNRVVCLYRDAQVVVTSWTDAPISWPRCRAVRP